MLFSPDVDQSVQTPEEAIEKPEDLENPIPNELDSKEQNSKEKRFGRAGRVVLAPSSTEDENGRKSESARWWPSCFHARWTKLDKTKFKDRILWLKECRRCGKKKTEIVYRDFNSRKVYVGCDTFAVNPVVQDVQDSDD